jgi:hypothetical protein
MKNFQQLLNEQDNLSDSFKTKKEVDYLPSLKCKEGLTWDVIEMHFCIDFGGRQVELVCQSRKEYPEGYREKSFTIYPLDHSLTQIPVEQKIVRIIHNMFFEFDTTEKLKEIKDEN